MGEIVPSSACVLRAGREAVVAVLAEAAGEAAQISSIVSRSASGSAPSTRPRCPIAAVLPASR